MIAAHQTMLAPQGAPLPYDAEVEYLESTGTQYIDTGVKLASDLTIRVRARYQQKSANVIRAADGNSRAFILFGSGSAEATSSVQAVNSTIGSGGSVSVALAFGEWADIVLSPSGLTVNGTTASSSGWSNYGTTNQNLYVFAFNDNGAASGFSSIPVASLDIYSGSTLVRSYVPVRVGQVGYLYDRVSGQLFGNSGTGAFVIGPDK